MTPKVIRYCLSTGSCGTLIVPVWKSAVYWPMIVDEGGNLRKYFINMLRFENVSWIYQNGSVESIFDSDFKSDVLALRINA